MSGRMTAVQIRGARAMLGWSRMDLARTSGLSVSTVRQAETEEAQPMPIDARLALWDAFRAAGVRFLDDEGGGSGVMLKTV